jgi:kynurenine formamidase
MDVIDLTRPMTAATLVALGGRKVREGWMVREVGVEWLRSWDAGDNTTQCTWTMSDHFGTHVDAPVHVVRDGVGVDQLDLGRLVGPAVVMDLRSAVGRGITAADLERADPQPEPGDIVLIYAGEPPGDIDHFLTHQTFVTVGGAEWLVRRGVGAVGVETACFEHSYQRTVIDRCYEPPETNPWPAHRVCLENNVYIIEGLTNLAPLAGERVHFAAAPLPVPGSSGSPVRAIAWR